MMLLAKTDYRARKDTVRVLAGSDATFTEQDIETLYVYGCPRELLCSGNIPGTESWNRAARKCFPAWQELPEPVRRQQPQSGSGHNGLTTAVLVLVALTAAVPGAVLWILGAGTVISYGAIAGVLTLLALISLTAAAVQKKRAARRFQLCLAWALLPGILTAVTALAMIILSR